MGFYVKEEWSALDGPGLPAAAKRGGTYKAYVPDKIADGTQPIIPIPAELTSYATQLHRQIAEVSIDIEPIARFLLHSEAISSSRIEGIAPHSDKIALAELALEGSEPVRGFPASSEDVARNITIVSSSQEQLAGADTVSVDDLIDLQAQLLGPRTRLATGLRTIQNWVGGSHYNPIGADFVPPPPRYVPELMDDLIAFINTPQHSPLIQAAIAHAQMETIHPFLDGNGRVGRALIHLILGRAGLVRDVVFPVSLVLGSWSESYIAGLTAYRAGDETTWVRTFLEACDMAIVQSGIIASDLKELQTQWEHRVSEDRQQTGRRGKLRTDSAQAKILRALPSHPLLTARTAATLCAVSVQNARVALESLAGIGILRKKTIGPGGLLGYLADDVFALLDTTERRLASSQFDTAAAQPSARAVPLRR